MINFYFRVRFRPWEQLAEQPLLPQLWLVVQLPPQQSLTLELEDQVTYN
jgi:hypothetical protein